jgi:hypothetical protein
VAGDAGETDPETVRDDAGVLPEPEAVDTRKDPFALKGLEAIDPALLDDIRDPAELKLDEVLEKHRSAATPEERLAALRQISVPLHAFLGAGGEARHLPYLAEVAENAATAKERKEALIAVHALSRTEVVDYLLDRTRSPHPDVRFYAYEGLCWVRGRERDRALEGALRGLEDPDGDVRGITAAGIALIAKDERKRGAIVDRLRRETDGWVAATMANAVLKGDPVGGRRTLEGLKGSLGTEAAAAVTAALAAAR